ncbi:restriction endonuclease subunit S [Streptomyces sp. NPDC058545]|uniref:restriction endonuclease subunit S n=1 Tax=Streptomyces sp. NPDC058545 TaxID=3346544 RepID=UPI00365A728A
MTAYRIKDVARINRRTLSEATNPGCEFKYIDIGAVDGLGNVDIPNERVTFAAAPSRARRLAPSGAVIVSTVRTYLRAIAVVPSSQDPLVFSTGFAVLEAESKIESRFLGYYCCSQPFIHEIVARSTGVSYPAINASEIGNLTIPLPPLEEQRRIADLLDAETARIDQLSAAMRTQDALLAQRRLCVVDSVRDGTEGCAPSARLGYLTTLVTSGSRGWSEYVSDTGELFFRSANLHSDRITAKLANVAYVDVPEAAAAEARRARIVAGDVLIGITGANAGWVCLAGDDVSGGYVSQHVCLVRPDPRHLNGEWLALLMASPTVQSDLLGSQYGGTKTQLSLPDVREIHIPTIPIQRQVQAARSVRRRIDIIDRQRTLRLRQLQILAERRQALITAAVTGQFDVSTASGRNVTEGVTV